MTEIMVNDILDWRLVKLFHCNVSFRVLKNFG